MPIVASAPTTLAVGVALHLLGLALLGACAHAPPRFSAAADVHVEPLAEGVFLHTSYREIPPWGRVRTNGLLVEADQGLVLVDTAWNDAQTSELLDWAERTLRRRVTAAVFTHAHDDKMGGVRSLEERGVKTFAHPRSNELAPGRGLAPAAHDLEVGADGRVAPEPALGALVLHYPGAAHTEDNIVALVKGTGVLFGGCLIRPASARDLGNVADADVAGWASAVEVVSARFPEARVVVPSHGPPGGRELLVHTIDLATSAVSARAP